MARFLVAGVVLWACQSPLSAADATTRDRDFRIGQPQLALNAEGHTADVKALVFTRDGQQLITVSDDRTIRLWDVHTGETRHIIRVPIAGAKFGTLYSCDVSPDGRLLAVGEFSEAPGDPAAVYLISLEDYQIVHRLEGHEGSVFGVQFSADGRRLVSGSGWDMAARIWDVATGRSLRVIKNPEKVWDVIFSPDAQTVATACYDGNCYLWSAADGRLLRTLTGHTGLVESVAWSRDGRRIATGGSDGTIRLWSPDGRALQTFSNSIAGFVKAVEFSPDGTRLLATHLDRLGNREPVASIIDLAQGTQKLKFAKHTGGLWDATFSPDGRLVASTGGDSAETYIWNADTGRVVARLAARSRAIYSAAWGGSGSLIAWGTTHDRWNKYADSSNPISIEEPLERTFDLERLEFGDSPGSYGARFWRRFVLSREGLSLQQTAAAAIDVLRFGARAATLDPDIPYNRDHDFFWCATLLPGKLAAVASSFAFDLYSAQTGDVVRQLRGHTGAVTTVAVSPDDRYLLSASDDQTLRIWDPQRGEPLLSLFFAGDDWIAWTPEGYYAASPGGERLMGWHVNTALDRVAAFYPAAQFRKEFYRPDVVKLLLKAGSVERALQQLGGDAAVQSVGASLPPRVAIVSPAATELTVSDSKLEVTVEAEQTGGHPLTSVQLLVNGRPLGGQAGVVRLTPPQRNVRHTFTVPLLSGVAHTLQARVDSAVSYGVSKAVEVTVTAPTLEERPPSLYVLAIGVSEYDDATLALNFAHDDAQRLAQTFQQQGRGVFHRVETRLLTNKEANARGILAGLVWLKQQMTQHDVGVLFFSGHGDRDETGNFYLLPSDVDKSQPLILSAVSDAQIKGILQGIPGRLLVLLDACHAGTLGGDVRKSAAPLTDDLVRDLATDDYGVVVMASSMGREFSLENAAQRSGMFTLALVEGLQGKADFNGDQHIYFNELDTYVSDRVKELTQGRQHPVTAKPATIRSFPLARVAPP